MENKQLTPEERLLKIIEDPAGSDAKEFDNVVLPDLAKQHRKFKLSFSDWGRKLKMLWERIGFALFIQGLMLLAVMATIFLVWDFVNYRMGFVQRISRASDAPLDVDLSSVKIKSEKVDLIAILANSKKRDIFQLAVEKPREVTTVQNKDVSLKLVGILWSDSPQVMLEDAKDSRTHMLNEGDQISGLKIKKIYKDKVILEDSQGELELQ